MSTQEGGINLKEKEANELTTQIIVAMMQKDGFRISVGRTPEDSTRAFTQLICESYETVRKTILEAPESTN